MYCGKCGVRSDDRDMFCAECGSSLKIKKKKFVRNTIVSGKGLLTDYSGVVVKISVILIFLVVTGSWIFMGELTGNALEFLQNTLVNAGNIQWQQMGLEGGQIGEFIMNSMWNLFQAWIQAEISAFHSAPVYLKAWYILNAVCRIWMFVTTFLAVWRLFEKAGIQGWKMLIPIYNIYCISRIVYKNGWAIFAQIIVGIILYVLIIVGCEGGGLILIVLITGLCVFVFWGNIAENYEHGLGYTFGLIFMPALFLQLIGWGNERYW